MRGFLDFIKRNAVTMTLVAVALGYVAYQRIPQYFANQAALERPPAAFEAASLDGGQYTLDSLKGKFVVISFWATWCMPCRAEIPMLNSVFEELHGEGLVILGITAEEKSVVQEFLKDTTVQYPVIIDEYGRITSRYGVQAFPTLIMIDRQGNLVDRGSGLDFFIKWKIRKQVTGSYL
ncbi:MAG: TlpA family protein disulfide reductase [Leptospiraceae bacterium]|nr:TlpA family protein disulfide reductase [Leptospiraceae bacterium]